LPQGDFASGCRKPVRPDRIMYTFRLCLALAVACTSALQTKQHEGDGERVCISLIAFEDAEYIDLLVANMLAFTEPSTKLALHLNAKTKYDAERIAAWNTSRVVVTDPRVAVDRFMGSVFTAHLSNAWAMEARWPGECAYYVYQSSNMMWVRKGLEKVVRESRYSQISGIENPKGKSATHEFYGQMLKNGRGVNAESHPEGSFYPMSTVLSFGKLFSEYLASKKETLDSVSNFPAYFEASWFQTYALNFDDPPPADRKSFAPPLCFRHLGVGGPDEDSVEMEAVVKVAEGTERPYNFFYGVKRVARDLEHPVTKYIAKLTKNCPGSK